VGGDHLAGQRSKVGWQGGTIVGCRGGPWGGFTEFPLGMNVSGGAICVVVVRGDHDGTTERNGTSVPPVEATAVGTYLPARRARACVARGIERTRARPGPQTSDTLGCIACHRWARLGCAVSTVAYAQCMQG
jgi:hypothetical protein